jgi:hypothetical protein
MLVVEMYYIIGNILCFYNFSGIICKQNHYDFLLLVVISTLVVLLNLSYHLVYSRPMI